MIDTLVHVGPTTIAQLRERAGLLFLEHWKELEPWRPGAPLDVDWEALEAAERRNDLVVLAAWSGTTLIGYSVASFSRGLFHRQLMLVVQATFVTAAKRGTGVARELRAELRDRADAAAARLVWHAKPGSDAARVLERWAGPACELQFME